MTKPRNDGRPAEERAREMLNTRGGFAFHERSSEGYEALVWAMGEITSLRARIRELENLISLGEKRG